MSSGLPIILEYSESEFYETLGRAIAEWAEVENELMEIFQFAACGPLDDRFGPKMSATAAAFHAVLPFQGRLNMTTDAIMVRLIYRDVGDGTFIKGYEPLPLFSETWKPIHNRLAKLATERNKLAHRPAIAMGETTDEGKTINWPLALRRNIENPKFDIYDDTDAIELPQVENMRFDFRRARYDIANFGHAFTALLNKLPKWSE